MRAQALLARRLLTSVRCGRIHAASRAQVARLALFARDEDALDVVAAEVRGQRCEALFLAGDVAPA